jgi:hypothetical protein
MTNIRSGLNPALPDRLTANATGTVLSIGKPGPCIGAGLTGLIGQMVFTIVAPDIELVLARHEIGAGARRRDIGGLRARQSGSGSKAKTNGAGENVSGFHAGNFARKPDTANVFMTKELMRVTHDRPFGTH